MRAPRWILLCVLAAACGGAQKPGLPASARGLFQHVGADTPYLLAMLTPPPPEYREMAKKSASKVKSRLAPLLAILAESHEPALRFVGELGALLDVEQLASAGTVEQLVFYGHGLLPVVRVRLPDVASARKAIAEAATKSGVTLVDRGHGMQGVAVENVGEVIFGLRDAERELVIGFAPPGETKQMAEHLAGRSPPKQSFVPRYVDLEGGARYGFGHVDTGRLVAAVAARIPLLSGETCGRELAALAGVAPRAYFATEELSGRRMLVRGIVELRADVAARLADLRVSAPGLGVPLGESILHLGFALDLKKGVTAVADAAGAFVALGHKCLPLREVDQMVEEARQALAGGPSVLGPYQELLGVALIVQAMEPGTGTGYLLVTASDPFQLFDLAKNWIPGLANIQLRGDGVPVTIPAGTLFLPMDGYLAVRGQTLGIGLGKGAERAMATALAQAPSRDRPVFSMAADMPKLKKLFDLLGPILGTSSDELFDDQIYRTLSVHTYFDERGIVFVMESTP